MLLVIFITTLITGKLDFTAACIKSYLLNSTMPTRVLRYVTIGVFGTSAFTGGDIML